MPQKPGPSTVGGGAFLRSLSNHRVLNVLQGQLKPAQKSSTFHWKSSAFCCYPHIGMPQTLTKWHYVINFLRIYNIKCLVLMVICTPNSLYPFQDTPHSQNPGGNPECKLIHCLCWKRSCASHQKWLYMCVTVRNVKLAETAELTYTVLQTLSVQVVDSILWGGGVHVLMGTAIINANATTWFLHSHRLWLASWTEP